MNFTKQMIDLVREIRRRASSDDKPGIKLANPELLEELIPIYQLSTDAVTRALIKELFFAAGEAWSERLQAPATAQPQGGGLRKTYITKTYRGQTQLVEVPLPEAAPAPAPQRVYRGRSVNS